MKKRVIACLSLMAVLCMVTACGDKADMSADTSGGVMTSSGSEVAVDYKETVEAEISGFQSGKFENAGNNPSNLVSGRVAFDGKHIYYRLNNDKSIYKIDKNGKNKTIVASDIYELNVYDGYLYGYMNTNIVKVNLDTLESEVIYEDTSGNSIDIDRVFVVDNYVFFYVSDTTLKTDYVKAVDVDTREEFVVLSTEHVTSDRTFSTDGTNIYVAVEVDSKNGLHGMAIEDIADGKQMEKIRSIASPFIYNDEGVYTFNSDPAKEFVFVPYDINKERCGIQIDYEIPKSWSSKSCFLLDKSYVVAKVGINDDNGVSFTVDFYKDMQSEENVYSAENVQGTSCGVYDDTLYAMILNEDGTESLVVVDKDGKVNTSPITE